MNNRNKITNALLEEFAKITGCNVQYGNCPCNTCFHDIEGDFKHLVWLIILGLRGDYDEKQISEAISKHIDEELYIDDGE